MIDLIYPLSPSRHCRIRLSHAAASRLGKEKSRAGGFHLEPGE
jgi:hypothetical protein